MFLFSLIGGLFATALTLVLIPLRLAMNLLTLPLQIVGRLAVRHFGLLLVLLAGWWLYAHLQSSPSVPRELTPAEMPAAAPQPAAAAALVQPVRRREDGNSAFAADLFTAMTPIEQGNYSHYFYWAMDHGQDGQTVVWSAANIAGNFVPASRFENSDGQECRRFHEVLKVHDIEQTLDGIACRKESGGWCKLKANATPACGLGQPDPGILDTIGGSVRNLF